MHDGMQYDPIQGHAQGQGHEHFKVGNPVSSAIYKLSSQLTIRIPKLEHNI